MFLVSDADAAAVRAVLEADGELSAAIELRRRFKGLEMADARDCVRAIAGWEPLMLPLRHGRRLKPSKRD